MNRRDFQELAVVRLAEAQALLAAGRPDGAYYLAGYAIECALKATISRATRRYDFPDKKSVDASYTHNLKDLLKAAKLEASLAAILREDSDFRIHWDLVCRWSEQSRYRRQTMSDATELVRAVADRRHGVLRWLKQRW